jgi:hypothetical protein
MRYQQFLDVVLGRCRSLGFVDPETNQVNAGEVELAAYQSILDIVDGWDLDAFTVINEQIATTATGVRDYPLPGDFGRLMIPREDVEPGIFILTSSTASPTPMRYRDPEEWFRVRTTNNGQPSHFTIVGNDYLRVDPPPDDNGGSNYTLQGTYIKRFDVLDDDDPILVSHPTALIATTLARVAIDRGAPQANVLIAESARGLSKLVNNQSRVRQQFRSRYNQERSMRRSSL